MDFIDYYIVIAGVVTYITLVGIFSFVSYILIGGEWFMLPLGSLVAGIIYWSGDRKGI